MVTTADAIKLDKGRGVTGSTLEAITWQKQTYISYIKTKTFILPMEVVEQQTSYLGVHKDNPSRIFL